MVDSINQRKASDDLDLALNPPQPPVHDFLANVDIQRESTEASGVEVFMNQKKNPLEINPDSARPNPPPNPSPEPIKNIEIKPYDERPQIVTYFSHLLGGEGNYSRRSKLKDLWQIKIGKCRSIEDVEMVLDNAVKEKIIKEADKEEILGFLNGEELPLETKREFVIPQELIGYIENLDKKDTDMGAGLVLEVLKNGGVPRDEVIKILHDYSRPGLAFSEEEHKKMLRILGEPVENVDAQAGADSSDDLASGSSITLRKRGKWTTDELTEAVGVFVVPEELLSYLKSLLKYNIGPQSLLEEIEKEGHTKEDVLQILSDGFYHLHALTLEQYTQALAYMESSDLGRLDNKLEDMTDQELVELSDGAIALGRFGRAIRYANEIKEPGLRGKIIIDGIILNLINNNELENAEEIAEMIEDEDAKHDAIDAINFAKKSKQKDEKPLAPEAQEELTGVAKARLDYAKAKVDYDEKNKKLRRIKDLIKNIKTVSEGEKTESEKELEEAKERMETALFVYIEAKKIRRDETVLNPQIAEGEKVIKLLELAENEWVTLQKTIAELTPTGLVGRTIERIDKNGKIEQISQSKIIQKALAVWTRQDWVGTSVRFGVRTVVPSVVIGLLVGATGGLGAGVAVAGGAFTGRTAGFVGAGSVGAINDVASSVYNKRVSEEYDTAYKEGVTGDSFEELEKKYMKAREQEQRRKRLQKITKAVTMVGAGFGAGLLSGTLIKPSVTSASPIEPSSPKASGSVNVARSFDGVRPRVMPAQSSENVSVFAQAKSSGMPAVEDVNKPSAEQVVAPKPMPSEAIVPKPVTPPEGPKIVEMAKVKVEASSRGALDTIHKLKSEILKAHGNDVNNIPQEIKENFFDKPTVEIAKKYGLYKPGDLDGDSAIIFKGDNLGVDDHGHLVYEHGGKSVDMVSPEGKIVKFEETGGEMSLPKTLFMEPTPIKVEIPPEPEIKIPKEEIIPLKSRDTVSLEGNIPKETGISPIRIPYKGSFVDVMSENGAKIMRFGEQTIAHEQLFGTKKIMVLDKVFQDGSQYSEIRAAFSKAFQYDDFMSSLTQKNGVEVISKEFEGGAIHLVRGLDDKNPFEMRALLNGEEFARGTAIKMKLVTGKGGGLLGFLVETPYERALKFTKQYLGAM